MSSFLSKIIDSSVSFVSSHSGRRVLDAQGKLATYATLAEALHSNGIDYSLNDYRIWSDNIPLDDHGRNSNTFVHIYGDGFAIFKDEGEAMNVFHAFYSENGRDSFYDSTKLTSVVIRIYDTSFEPLVEYILNSDPLKTTVVSDVIDAVGFCSEEHMSVAEFFDYMSKFAYLTPYYFIDEAKFKKEYLVFDSAKITRKRTSRRVSDARGRLATYATLAEALHSNGIDYSLDDYRIWSANIPLDDHGRNSDTFIQVYGDGFEGYASEDEAMDALGVFYDENGRDAFYDSITLTSLCVRVHDGENKPLLEWYVDSTSLRSSFVVGVIDAIGFCSEEHMSVAEFFDYMSKFVNLDTNYFIGEEEFEQKYLVYDSKVVSDDAKIAGKCTPRSVSDSEDLDGWYKGDSGHMIADLYVKEYDNMPDMKILGIRESQGGPVVHFCVSARLLDDLGFDDLENTLYFTKFDSLSEAAAVADRIAEAHSAYYKSLSDIIEK